jgi:hypothetical protein
LRWCGPHGVARSEPRDANDCGEFLRKLDYLSCKQSSWFHIDGSLFSCVGSTHGIVMGGRGLLLSHCYKPDSLMPNSELGGLSEPSYHGGFWGVAMIAVDRRRPDGVRDIKDFRLSGLPVVLKFGAELAASEGDKWHWRRARSGTSLTV